MEIDKIKNIQYFNRVLSDKEIIYMTGGNKWSWYRYLLRKPFVWIKNQLKDK